MRSPGQTGSDCSNKSFLRNMKVPFSVRSFFEHHQKSYQLLEGHVNGQMESIRESGWHYLGRLKALESFAQKLETGRFAPIDCLNDLFACTIVVERADRIKDAENKIREKFFIHERKPDSPDTTPHRASCFDFDYVRLYASLKLEDSLPATGLEDLVFEVQIKTFLQHAWSIATHDLIYKSDALDWESARVAYQVKAMLEHAEASISAVKAISLANQPARSDDNTRGQQEIIAWLQQTWPADALPRDIVRLADCVRSLMKTVGIKLDQVKLWLNEASEAGKGIHTLNLSPFGAIVSSVLEHADGLDALKGMAGRGRYIGKQILVPAELDFPEQSRAVEKYLCRIK